MRCAPAGVPLRAPQRSGHESGALSRGTWSWSCPVCRQSESGLGCSGPGGVGVLSRPLGAVRSFLPFAGGRDSPSRPATPAAPLARRPSRRANRDRGAGPVRGRCLSGTPSADLLGWLTALIGPHLQRSAMLAVSSTRSHHRRRGRPVSAADELDDVLVARAQVRERPNGCSRQRQSPIGLRSTRGVITMTTTHRIATASDDEDADLTSRQNQGGEKSGEEAHTMAQPCGWGFRT